MSVLYRIATTVLLCSAVVAFVPRDAHADEPIRNWWREARHNADWGKPCEIKLEKSKDGYKREVRCKNAKDTSWRGDWIEEFQDGGCKVRLEARRETFKEEVKCPSR